jgi:hypothetical protein
MKFQPLQLLQLAFTLLMLYVLSSEIIKTIGCIGTKTEGKVFNFAIICLVAGACVDIIAKTWLKTLIILTMENKDTTIIFMPKESQEKENSQAEDTDSQSPSQTPPMEKEGEIKSD